MKSIIEREATFENNSDMEVKVTQKQLSRAFVKETQCKNVCTPLRASVSSDFMTRKMSIFNFDSI